MKPPCKSNAGQIAHHQRRHVAGETRKAIALRVFFSVTNLDMAPNRGDTRMPLALWELYSGLRRLALQEEGQDLVEYSLTILLVVIAAVASAGGVASKILAMYSYINSKYP